MYWGVVVLWAYLSANGAKGLGIEYPWKQNEKKSKYLLGSTQRVNVLMSKYMVYYIFGHMVIFGHLIFYLFSRPVFYFFGRLDSAYWTSPLKFYFIRSSSFDRRTLSPLKRADTVDRIRRTE